MTGPPSVLNQEGGIRIHFFLQNSRPHPQLAFLKSFTSLGSIFADYVYQHQSTFHSRWYRKQTHTACSNCRELNSSRVCVNMYGYVWIHNLDTNEFLWNIDIYIYIHMSNETFKIMRLEPYASIRRRWNLNQSVYCYRSLQFSIVNLTLLARCHHAKFWHIHVSIF